MNKYFTNFHGPLKHLVIIAALLSISGFVAASLSTTARANNIGWNSFCDSANANPQEEANSGDGAEGGGCLLSNYYAMQPNERPDSPDQYLKDSMTCLDNPSQTDGGECMNAVRSCYIMVIDKTKCSDGNLTARIGDECGGVVHTGGAMDRGDDCNAISEANAATLTDDETAYKNKMKTCEQKPMGNERNNCYDTLNHAIAECAARAGLGTKDHNSRDGFDGGPYLGFETNDGGYNSMDLTRAEYNDCLDTQVRSNITDPALCKDVGGLWVEDKNAGNTVNGNTCYKQYSDLINADACKGAKSDQPPMPEGVWAQAKDGSWGCHLPSDVCTKDGKAKEGWKINDTAPCGEANQKLEEQMKNPTPGKSGFANSREQFKSCGEAQTVLLACDQQKDCPGSTGAFSGLPVLGCIIRIGIQVLTTLIGIGAVGGIAFEAFRYASASDSESQVSQAKTRIRDIIIGVLLWVFLIVVANWLIPGLGIQ